MLKRFLYRMALFGLLVLILTSLVSAVAASNSVPGSRAGRTVLTIDANALKPPECASMNLTNIVTGSGNIDGTKHNDLILGSPGVDTITGKGGTDCILGGGGNDDITGSNGGDVCIGGPGTDTFSKCERSIQ